MADVQIVGSGATLARLLNARVFSALLIGCTVVPFIFATMQGAAPTIDTAIIFLATIHVPMTAYLLCDPDIRAMMRRRPLALVVGPLACIIVGLLFMAWLPPFFAAGMNWSVVYFRVAVLTWQNWHFGKQNVGVCSFVRVAQRLGPLPIGERRLVVAGSVLGAMAAYFGAADVISERAPAWDFSTFLAPIEFLMPLAAAAQVGLLIASLVYVARNRSRFSVGYAVTLIVSANFFLPFYLTVVSLPNTFGYSAFAHGLQYILFLLYHAAGYRGAKWQAPVMLAAFLIFVAITGELWYFHTFPLPFADEIANGVLLAHFWFDSVIWRMRDPAARQWMTRRYAFLF